MSDAASSRTPRWLLRPRLLLVLAVSSALLLAVLERLERRWSSASVPTGAAAWIWATESARSSSPAAFYLVRDFEYREDASSEPLRLLLAVDEEYRLWVNGFGVTGGGFRPGAPLDEILVSDLLRSGTNRIVLEVRSRNGAGGMLATLRSGEKEPLLVSDATWIVARRHEPGLIEGLAQPAAPERPKVWQRPVTGRWARPYRDPGGQPLDARLAVVREGRDGSDRWADSIEPTSVRIRGGGGSGEDVDVPAVLIDFGTSLVGELELWLEADPTRVYSIDFSREEPPTGDVLPARLEGGIPSPEQSVVLLVPGRSWWRDTTTREFRWVRLRGVDSVAAARVQLHDDSLGPPRRPPGDAGEGPWLFGIEPLDGIGTATR